MHASNSFGIIDGKTDWGTISIVDLGYDCSISHDKVIVPPGHHFDHVISAHTNSEVCIALAEYSEITGFLCGTAHWDPCNPTIFTVNNCALGVAYKPLDATESIRLFPGRYTLRCSCPAVPHGRHSAWGVATRPSVAPARLAVVTVGRYPIHELQKKLYYFTRSATHFGILPIICGEGEPTRSWYLDKIAEILEVVKALPDSISHILFSDGCDSIFLGGEKEILSEFERFGSAFVISMERGCWPVHDPAWRETFPPAMAERRWPNAGGWIGTRDGVCAVLTECISLYNDIKGEGLKGSLARWQKFAHFAHDDQWLLQLVFLDGRVPMTPDYRNSLFTNVGTGSRVLDNNPDYVIKDNRVHCRVGESNPLIIHFSGGAWGHCGEQWAAQLGILR